VRTIGLARAQVKIGIANLADNFTRLAWLSTRVAPAQARSSVNGRPAAPAGQTTLSAGGITT
jgi:hypothetical protein